MQLVDEEDDASVGIFDFLQNRLQTLFEFAAEFRARNQRAHVERDDYLVFQALGNVARDDAQGEAFDDRGLADARLADEDGVVLRSAGEDLDDATNLLVASDDGIELSFFGAVDEVDSILFKRLQLSFGLLVDDAVTAAHDACAFENLGAIDREKV